MVLLKISYRMAHRAEQELFVFFILKKFNLLILGSAFGKKKFKNATGYYI